MNQIEALEIQAIGKYQVLGILGRGSMGVVYKARDPEIGRLVAIKTLRRLDASRAGSMETAIERFRNEARSAGNLRHPNIITVFEISRDELMPFIVMDYVDGDSLEAVIQKYFRLPPGLTIAYLSQIASAVDYAHQKGVVHRDLKPSNILVDRADNIFVLDFGVASINKSYTDWEAPSHTPLMGTPGYMAPEQILNGQVDRRSDLFSFAVMAFECFTGRRPFAGENFATVVNNIVNAKPLSLTALAPGLPLSLEAEFERALARRPEERFKNAYEMVRAFGKAVGIDIPGAISLNISGRYARESGALITGFSGLIAAPEHTPAGTTVGNAAATPYLGGGLSEQSTGQAAAELSGQPAQLANASSANPSGAPAGDTQPSAWAFSEREKKKAAIEGSQRLSGSTREGSARAIFGEEREALYTTAAAQKRARTSAFRLSGQTFSIALAVMILIVGVALLWNLIAEVRPAVTLPIASGDKLHDLATPELVSQSFSVATGDLVEPSTEPPPPGKQVQEMSDKQVLGLLKDMAAPEVMVLSALHEAQRRSLSALVDVSVYPLQNDSYVVRVEMIKALAEVGDKRIVPQLVLRLDDYDPLVRGHAAKALGILGDRRALGYLMARQMQEESSEVKDTIKRSIEKISGFSRN